MSCATRTCPDTSPVFPRRRRFPYLKAPKSGTYWGGAANVAANLRALGCQVRLLGVIGDDDTGRYVREQVRALGMADDLLMLDAERPTTEKTRLIARHQQLVRLDQESRLPLPPELIAQALSGVETILTEVDGLVCSDYNKGVCTPDLLAPLLAKAKAADLPVFIDPKARDFTQYRGATVLTPNLAEVRHATGATGGLLEETKHALPPPPNRCCNEARRRPFW